MSGAGQRKRIVFVVVLLLAVATIFFFRQRNRTGTAQKTVEKPSPAATSAPAAAPSPAPSQAAAIVSALAYLDLHGAELPAQKTAADYYRELGGDPDHIIQEVQKRVALAPYEGALNDPLRMLESGVGNSLDRARLVHMLLNSANIDSRIVSVDQDGQHASAQYATANPASAPVMEPSALQELSSEVTELSPKIVAQLNSSGTGGLSKNIAATKAEKRLYWVQYQSAGNLTDLIPADMTVDPAKRKTAQPLSASAMAGLTWQIKLSVANSAGHRQQEVLSFSAPASDLSGVAVSFLNQPDGSLKKFVPRLLVGDKAIDGKSFALADGSDLDSQVLKLDITGPSGQRHFVRTLVAPRDAANDDERSLEIATSAHITVLCGPISDEQFQRSLFQDLSQAGKILFGKTQEQNPVPINQASIPAMAVLDAAQRYAGHFTPSRATPARAGDPDHSGAGAQLLAFQARPALAVERDYIVTTSDSLVRRHSFDLIDPGHALYAANTSADVLLQAAAEQSVVDAWMEDHVAQGENLLTSRRALRDLLTAGATFTLSKPASALNSDNFGTVKPGYRLAQMGQGTTVAGWRVDPGPQLVPILGNLTGGTQADTAQRQRLEKLCTAISWGTMLVPADYFPQKFLFSSIAAYDCKLAQAYYKAADALDTAFAPLEGGSNSGANKAADDLKKQIEGLGPSLGKDAIKNAVGQAAGGLAIHGIKHYVTPAATSAARPFSQRPDAGALDSALTTVQQSLQSGSVDAIEQQAARSLPQ